MKTTATIGALLLPLLASAAVIDTRAIKQQREAAKEADIVEPAFVWGSRAEAKREAGDDKVEPAYVWGSRQEAAKREAGDDTVEPAFVWGSRAEAKREAGEDKAEPAYVWGSRQEAA